MLKHFLDEERVAFRLLEDDARQRRRRRLVAHPAQHRLDAGQGQTLQRDSRREPLPHQGFERPDERTRDVELDIAVRADDEQRRRRDGLGEVLQQEQRRLVGPVQILEDDDAWRHAAGAVNELAVGVEQEPALLFGGQFDRGRDV